MILIKFTTINFIIVNFMNKFLGKVKPNFVSASSMKNLTYRTIQRTNYHLTKNISGLYFRRDVKEG